MHGEDAGNTQVQTAVAAFPAMHFLQTSIHNDFDAGPNLAVTGSF